MRFFLICISGRKMASTFSIRFACANRNLPVVMFTAQGSVKNAVEAMRRGAVDFLEKPFTREQFHLVLARVQRFHQLNQNIERLEREVKDSNAQSPEVLLDSSMPLMKEVMETLLRAAKNTRLYPDLGRKRHRQKRGGARCSPAESSDG